MHYSKSWTIAHCVRCSVATKTFSLLSYSLTTSALVASPRGHPPDPRVMVLTKE